jgi:hypothetical protein
LRLSGVVSNWKNSLNDWICTSRRSGVSARCLILPKLTLLCSFVEDILFKPGFLDVRTSKLVCGQTLSRTEILAKGWFIETYVFCPQYLYLFGETEGKGKK